MEVQVRGEWRARAWPRCSHPIASPQIGSVSFGTKDCTLRVWDLDHCICVTAAAADKFVDGRARFDFSVPKCLGSSLSNERSSCILREAYVSFSREPCLLCQVQRSMALVLTRLATSCNGDIKL